MPKRIMQGTVVSDKNEKTVVVMVERRFTHPVMKKTVRLSKKYKADDENNAFTLAQAINLVTQNPARALNLHDRGVIAEGKRADLVLAHRKGEHIHIDHVWRQGKRVF